VRRGSLYVTGLELEDGGSDSERYKNFSGFKTASKTNLRSKMVNFAV
jgi:hypothetical protein